MCTRPHTHWLLGVFVFTPVGRREVVATEPWDASFGKLCGCATFRRDGKRMLSPRPPRSPRITI